MFQINGQPKYFIKITTGQLKKKTNKRAKFSKKIVLPCIKNTSEMTAILLQLQGNTVTSKPNKTMPRPISNSKEKPKMDVR